jgi:uncharacterized membrane protein
MAQATDERPGPTRLRRALGVAGYILSLMAQAFMIVLAVLYGLEEVQLSSLGYLVTWCLIGTLYELVALIALGLQSRNRNDSATHRPSRLELSAPARIIAFSATILASLVGLGAAIQLLTLRSDPKLGTLIDVLGVWAMLLSWGFLHWGFAQVYYQAYYASDERPLRFQKTDQPRFVDFVYFAYTVGTSFAVSDVETLRTSMRWRVLWHSVLSFFFNGLIIVLALNTIQNFAS